MYGMPDVTKMCLQCQCRKKSMVYISVGGGGGGIGLNHKPQYTARQDAPILWNLVTLTVFLQVVMICPMP